MNTETSFRQELWRIALPITLQSLLASSFSVVDQIMTGQLGSVSIAGIGLGGKFASLFSVLVSAVAAVAGIMIAQYVGKKDIHGMGRSFYINLFAALVLTVIFMVPCCLFPKKIMMLYTGDPATLDTAAGYLRIFSWTFFPSALISLLSTYLRCMEAASLPLYSGMAAAVLNTVLNYILIFGKFGAPSLGANGAALASACSQWISLMILFFLFFRIYRKKEWHLPFHLDLDKTGRKQYAAILLPILVCEFFWSLGENVYSSIYGHMGTKACAAMTLTSSIQVLLIGALSGVAQAAGILVGRSLGAQDYDKAVKDSKKLMAAGLMGSLLLSVLLILFRSLYTDIFQVEEEVRQTAGQILLAFALISPVKVQNMILSGGILRSGGKTSYVMVIDLVGTWIFGVPLGLLTAFVWNLPIPLVYFILSLEECVRLGISLIIFRRKNWMQSLR